MQMYRSRRKTPQSQLHQPPIRIRNEAKKLSSATPKRNQLCLLVVLLASTLFMRFRSQRQLSLALNDAKESTRKTTPSNRACIDDSVKGIYHIEMGDIGGAAGTIFFQFVIAQIMYAERHGLKPWVHFSNVSNVIYDNAVHGGGPGVSFTALTGRNVTYVRRKGGHRRDYTPGPIDTQGALRKEELFFEGTGVWNHYFEPVSDFVPGDRSCEDKLYVTMDLYLITPGLHGYAEYAPRCWRYKYLPDYISKPHLGLTEWLEPQRRAANKIVRKYIHPQRHLVDAAERINPNCDLENPCLGLHIRHSDKASGRRVIETAEFLPFAEAFISGAGSKAKIYLATDSVLVLDEVRKEWPDYVKQKIRSAGSQFLRSIDVTAVFDLDGSSQHHRVNQEVIIEILALARCQFLIHGLSAVSESSIWLNFDLHHSSVNLEDPEHLRVDQFKQLILGKLRKAPVDTWPHPVTTTDIWPELFNQPKFDPPKATDEACNGYDGVLLISSVGKFAGTTSAFFTSVLNQLVYAEMFSLKPWIHLKPGEDNSVIFDAYVHNSTGKMIKGMFVKVLNSSSLSPRGQDLSNSAKSAVSIVGNGIWSNYFLPASDFVPGDKSCIDKPVYEFPESMLQSELVAASATSVKAWRYDNVPNHLVWNGTYVFDDWFRGMRAKGHGIVQKYFALQPYLLQRAEQINQSPTDEVCLGVHLRNGEKNGQYREKVSPKLFVPYIRSFLNAGGKNVFVASDSHRAIQFLKNNLPSNISESIRSQGEHVVRSTKLDWPLHFIEESHHRVNSEALVDVLLLSKCHLLLHGFSTLSEAAFYLNPELQDFSVNLENPNKLQPGEFALLTKRLLDKHDS